jgi:polyribonucleotide nucleotidyltransferase
VDATGKIKGSRKAVLLKDRGEEYVAKVPGGRGGDRGGRGGRDRDRGGRDRDRGGRDRDRGPRADRGDRPPRHAEQPAPAPDRGGE